MRAIVFEGIEFILSERDWKKLLARFDAGKASLNTYGYYLIPVRSICYTRGYKCIRCPLNCPQKKINSCNYLFEKLIGEENMHKLHLRDSGILWYPEYDADVRVILQKLTDFFSRAVPVKKRKANRADPAA
ncbi:MAG: hypothetical protein WC370_05630 [Dehalococcoidales bacterium]